MTNLSNDRGQETYDTYDLKLDYGASEPRRSAARRVPSR